jgi:hypothetical protein
MERPCDDHSFTIIKILFVCTKMAMKNHDPYFVLRK